MKKNPGIVCLAAVLILAGIQGVHAEVNSGNESVEKEIELDENSERDREFRELDKKIENEIDALDITDTESVAELLDDLDQMTSSIDHIANVYFGYDYDYKLATDERGVKQSVYWLPEKPDRVYLDGKVRCMYVYPARYSNRGAYVYLSESGRAAFIKYDQGSVRYYVVDDTLLRFMTVMDDLSVCWDLPEWEPHGGNPWTQLDNPYIPLIKPEGYESTYEFQSVIAASWINTIRSLQEQFDSVAEQ